MEKPRKLGRPRGLRDSLPRVGPRRLRRVYRTVAQAADQGDVAASIAVLEYFSAQSRGPGGLLND